MKRRGIDQVAVANFLASLDGMSITDAFANARADGKSYGWNAATQTAVANGIARRFQSASSPRCEYAPEGHGRCALSVGHRGEHAASEVTP